MKKYTSTLSILIAILFAVSSCKEGQSDSKNQSVKSSGNGGPYAFHFNSEQKKMDTSGVGNRRHPEIATLTGDMIKYSIAKPLVDSYITDQDKITNTYHFIFNANSLRQYIDSVKSPIIQFFLGEDTNKNLVLLAAMVDSSGGNSYLKHDSNYYLLIASTDTTLNNWIEDTSETPAPGFYVGAISASRANTCIDDYREEKEKNTSANSWLYNANDLEDFIKNSSNIKYIQVFLCVKNNVLDLVICGIDATTMKQICFKYNKNYCVFENANPCPTCEVEANSSLTLSDPNSRK